MANEQDPSSSSATAFLQSLSEVSEAAEKAFRGAMDTKHLENARIELLGKSNGRLKSIQEAFAKLSAQDKQSLGADFQSIKRKVEHEQLGAKLRLGQIQTHTAAKEVRDYISEHASQAVSLILKKLNDSQDHLFSAEKFTAQLPKISEAVETALTTDEIIKRMGLLADAKERWAKVVQNMSVSPPTLGTDAYDTKIEKIISVMNNAATKEFAAVIEPLVTEDRISKLLRSASKDVSSSAFDSSQPGLRPRLGHIHPLTQTVEELKEIMGRLGFTVAHGPEIEDERHNFEALNIPAAHPARDPLENFYLATAKKLAGEADAPMLLRSQTSTVQIRVMESNPPPVRIISLGRVYRPDAADATHYPMFHQIEGLLIDKHVTMADLKSTLRLFARSYFGGDVHIRFRPSFFPFTEPSVEVDMQWNERWIEMGGAGMVDPNVLRAVGYDPDEVTGFAFGLGVERVCARRHQVTDIREFYKNDVRFLEQF